MQLCKLKFIASAAKNWKRNATRARVIKFKKKNSLS